MLVVRESATGFRFCILGIVALMTILLGLIFATRFPRSVKKLPNLLTQASAHQTVPTGVFPNPAPQPDTQAPVPRTQAASSPSRVVTENLPVSIRAILRGNRGYIRRVALSPNGKTLASVADSASLTLWDLGTRSVQQERDLDVGVPNGTTVEHLSNSISHIWFIDGSLVFSPNSRTLAYQWLSGIEYHTTHKIKYVNIVRILDVASGRFETLFSGYQDEQPKGVPTGMSYTPDGKTLVAGFRGGVAILQSQGGKIRAILQDEKHPYAGGNAVSPREPYLLAAIADPFRVLVYDLATRTKVAELTPSDPRLNRYPRFLMVRFSPDGKRLAASTPDNGFVLWDVATWKEIAVVQEGAGQGWTLGTCYLAFTPDSKSLLTTSRGFTDVLSKRHVRRRDAITGKEVSRLELDQPCGPWIPAEFCDTYPRLFSQDGKFLIGLGMLKNDEHVEGFLVIHDISGLLDGPGSSK